MRSVLQGMFVKLIRVNGMMKSESNMGARYRKRRKRRTRGLGDSETRGKGLLKKQNSYRMIIKGKVKAFSFVFIARTAERTDRANHRTPEVEKLRSWEVGILLIFASSHRRTFIAVLSVVKASLAFK